MKHIKDCATLEEFFDDESKWGKGLYVKENKLFSAYKRFYKITDELKAKILAAKPNEYKLSIHAAAAIIYPEDADYDAAIEKLMSLLDGNSIDDYCDYLADDFADIQNLIRAARV